MLLDITGTSNSATTTISLPVPASSLITNLRSVSANYDGSSDTLGVLYLSDVNTLASRKGMNGTGGTIFTNWATSGTKSIIGAMFTYEAA